MKAIRAQRFEILVGYSRLPHAVAMSKEIEWYASADETLLATILLDFSDNDFTAIILGRDADFRYRCIDIEVSFEAPNFARAWLVDRCEEILGKGESIFPQGDERGKKMDVFSAIYAENKLNPNFVKVRDMSGYSSAREIIQEMMHHYTDIDGNYIEQFQTSGFDSRLWELYLFAYLIEEKMLLDRSFNAPDFLATNGIQSVAIEAVTVQATSGAGKEIFKYDELTPEKIKELQRDYMPIKFGSPLFSKLQKKYWEKEHVKGKPLVFAIADFHQEQSMLWSSTALSDYLYGRRYDFHHDANHQLIISPIKVDFHEYNGKKIPSGFFFTPDTENVSAVLFSATGTISKFLRMGKIAGFGDRSVIIMYQGAKHRFDPNSAIPDLFAYTVDDKYEENWGHGINIFHNPNALIPLGPSVFPSATHHHLRADGLIESQIAEFHPYTTTTCVIIPR